MIRIVEVGPRDGLQNEAAQIPTADKVAFIDALSQSGVDEIEVSAFVAASWVPQLADAEAVFTAIRRHPAITYAALIPNMQGLERALAVGVGKVAVFTAASDAFNRKNVNTDIDGTFARMQPVVARARALGLPVRGYISTAFWCPYAGYITPARTVAVAQRLLDLGVNEISVGDTIGKATPHEVETVVQALAAAALPPACLALHVHDTYGRAIDNVLAAWRLGILTFDASVAGLGGCPYAPGAAGNVATEQLVAALAAAGAPVAVDLAALGRARDLIAPFIGHALPPFPQ